MQPKHMPPMSKLNRVNDVTKHFEEASLELNTRILHVHSRLNQRINVDNNYIFTSKIDNAIV